MHNRSAHNRHTQNHDAKRKRRVAMKVTQYNKIRHVLQSNGLLAAHEYAIKHTLLVRLPSVTVAAAA